MTGTVTAQTRKGILVTYVVGGQSLEVQGLAPTTDARELGAEVPVYFLPDDPHSACVGNPTDLYREQLLLTVVFVAMAVIWAIGLRVLASRRMFT